MKTGNQEERELRSKLKSAIRAIIVDDENKAREELTTQIQLSCTEVELVGVAESVDRAIELIERLNPEVVFLDIEMPGKNGFRLLEHFEEYNFSVIFTTAYDAYAIKAIRFSALDYLLKPIQKSELMDAVQRVLNKRQTPSQFHNLVETIQEDSPKTIVLNTHDAVVVKEVSEIVRFEADRNYTFVHFADGNRMIMSKPLRYYQDLLDGTDFLRCHRSHLVNVKHVDKVMKRSQWTLELKDKSLVPISVRKKNLVVQVMNV